MVHSIIPFTEAEPYSMLFIYDSLTLKPICLKLLVPQMFIGIWRSSKHLDLSVIFLNAFLNIFCNVAGPHQ